MDSQHSQYSTLPDDYYRTQPTGYRLYGGPTAVAYGGHGYPAPEHRAAYSHPAPEDQRMPVYAADSRLGPPSMQHVYRDQVQQEQQQRLPGLVKMETESPDLSRHAPRLPSHSNHAYYPVQQLPRGPEEHARYLAESMQLQHEHLPRSCHPSSHQLQRLPTFYPQQEQEQHHMHMHHMHHMQEHMHMQMLHGAADFHIQHLQPHQHQHAPSPRLPFDAHQQHLYLHRQQQEQQKQQQELHQPGKGPARVFFPPAHPFDEPGAMGPLTQLAPQSYYQLQLQQHHQQQQLAHLQGQALPSRHFHPQGFHPHHPDQGLGTFPPNHPGQHHLACPAVPHPNLYPHPSAFMPTPPRSPPESSCCDDNSPVQQKQKQKQQGSGQARQQKQRRLRRQEQQQQQQQQQEGTGQAEKPLQPGAEDESEDEPADDDFPVRLERLITCKTYLKRLHVTHNMVKLLLPLQKGLETKPGSLHSQEYQSLFKVRISLVDEDGFLWPVDYEGATCSGQKHLRLTSGWQQYAQQHRLSVGDSVVFERRDASRLKLLVTINRSGAGNASATISKRRKLAAEAPHDGE